MPYEVFAVMMLLLGLSFGSFANVVIWRFPRHESLSSPPSHCPSCQSAIQWYDNIPVVSWLVLRGRCRACAEPISVRYPVVELLSGVLWLVAGLEFGVALRALAAAIFFYLLLILSAIDLDTRRLPNPIVGLCVGIGFAGAVVYQLTGLPITPLLDSRGWLASPVVAAVVGAVGSAGIALAIALTYAGMRRREGFGMGDVKLLGAIGLFLGPLGVLVLFLASVAGAIVGIIMARRSQEGLAKAYPFGPFLAAAAVLIALYGPEIWGWYVGLLGVS